MVSVLRKSKTYSARATDQFIDGRNWAFFDWIPQSLSPGQMTGIHRPARQVHMRTDSSQSTATAGLEEQQGGVTKGTYSSIYSHPRQSYDPLDPSESKYCQLSLLWLTWKEGFCVRPSTFFEEGRVRYLQGKLFQRH